MSTDRRIAVGILLLVCLLSLLLVSREMSLSVPVPVDPSNWTHMVIFDCEGLEGHAAGGLDGLQAIPHERVASDDVRAILSNVEFQSREPIWKGSWLAVVEAPGGQQYRLAISPYGGFFKIVGQDGIYQTKGDSRKRLEAVMRSVLIDVFIPARRHSRASEK